MATPVNDNRLLSARAYYAHLGQIEKRLQKKMRSEKSRNNEEAVELYWHKILDIKQRRRESDYRQALAKTR